MLTRRSHLVALSALALPTASRAFSLSEGDAAGECPRGAGARRARGRGAAGPQWRVLDHAQLRIPPPGALEKPPQLLKATGQGKRVDDSSPP